MRKVERITLGRMGQLSLASARAAVDKIRGDVALGIDVTGTRKALRLKQRGGRTLHETFADFVAGDRHKPKTALDYENLWTLYLGRLGARRVEDVTADDIRRLHISVCEAVGSRRQVGRNGHRTANKVVSLMRAVLNFAGRKADNPAAGVSLFKQAPRRRRLSNEEATEFRSALGTLDPVWRDFFLLSLLTGVRRQSLLSMRWSDLDLAGGRWIVPAIWSKHGDEIIVPLTREATLLLAEMQERRGTSLWVFPSRTSASGHIEEPKAAWSRLLKAANIQELRIHDLRRTFGSRLAETGANGAVIAAAMGHKSLQSARSYLHLQIDAVREAAERAAIAPGGDR